ncbi:ABC transporter substrate-binding protein [Paracoccus laeviglucosivorans]|uniref:NitT/TauT family transport system substrate-binding protein n=1 Tax=Paracoccus laeviglucosivorans TaxID=1197861 RepID=A0A521FDB3_9RHOB|nr:ABC transporter substrate-binding protein [Paracoccus laeviglucosivorans]SMO93500.1 NitT/TauT family transport system substrate-binding protein [Paracoccus laeviglucosivorans]
MKFVMRLAAVAIAAGLTSGAAGAEEVRFAKQLQVNNLPSMLVEHDKLFEKHAAALGEPDLTANWLTFANGGAAVDAMISGNVEFVSVGLTNFGVIWARTGGKVKGVAGVGGVALPLLTRNPDVKTLDDFKSSDRIAVPTVKVSNQAVMLSMALAKLHGPEARNKLDEQTVQLGHSDALQALLNPQHEVNTHFSTPPYSIIAMKDPRIHKVMDSNELFDAPLNSNVMFAQTAYHDANPVAVQAIIAALNEANAMIAADPERAAELYLQISGDKLDKQDVVALLKDRGTIFSTKPQGTLEVVQYMADTGLIPKRPETLQDMFFPEILAETN